MKKYIVAISAICLSITFVCQKDALFDRYTINDDVNQYIFPFYTIKDPCLFQNDILAEYSLKHNSVGTVFIYNLFSVFFDPLILTKILPFILCWLSAIYVFLIGKDLYSLPVGFLAANMFTLYSWTFFYFSGGNPRAFAFPLALSFIYYLIKNSYAALSIILILQILFYPPIALISIFILIILVLQNTKNSICETGKKKVYKKFYFCCIIIISFIMLYFLYGKRDNFMGSLVSFNDIVNMAEFHSDGRVPFFVGLHKIFTDRAVMERIIGMPINIFPAWFLIYNLFFGLFLISEKKVKINQIFNIFLISSLIMYILSWLLLFRFFYPGRYLKFYLPIYLIFLSALIINKYVIEEFNCKTFFRLSIISLLIIILFLPFLHNNLSTFRNKGLYKFLSTLPKECLLAGHPAIVNEIPLYSKRKVFVQEELSLPFYKNYYQMIRRRTYDFFRLYYSCSIDEVKNICKKYKIDYLILAKEHFKKIYLDKRHFYFEPFNTKIIHIVLENINNGFILINLIPRCKVYEDGEFIVINSKLLF